MTVLDLSQHLARCYAEAVLHERTCAGARDALKAALDVDPAMKVQAQAMLDGIAPDVLLRDYITKVQKGILTDVLSNP